jgi:predicted DNA-binding transcriptional regulator AlpA
MAPHLLIGDGMDQLITIKEASLKYRISRSSLYRLIRDDPQFPWQNVGAKKKLVVSEILLKRWIAHRSIKQEIIKLPSQTILIRRFINGSK